MTATDIQSEHKKRRFFFSKGAIFISSIIFFVGTVPFFYNFLNEPPRTFPVDTMFEVEPGDSVRAIASKLKQEQIIRSEWYFYYHLVSQHDPRNIKASTYYLDTAMTTKEIIERFMIGDFRHNLVRVTFPEGIRTSQMADILVDTDLTDFEKNEFLLLATESEGMLFPDTYFVPHTFTAEDWYQLLRNTHDVHMETLKATYNSDLDRHEIVILASILEREANSVETKRMVSGILQNRLAINMPLQADATIEYVLEKPLNELVPSDLEINSPYNTYLNRGLPPTPIGNPGYAALEAVFNPTPSSYLFYITGRDGNFYYAADFDKHRLNIARYLR